jgi:transcriptional regulator with XRE-family HTH domain
MPAGDRPYWMRRLAPIRRMRRLTQEQLAWRAHVSVSTIRNAETGKREPRADSARRIAQVLGVSLHELYDVTPNYPEDEDEPRWTPPLTRA